MSADCQKKLANGDLCEISAVGRCRTCEEAFCRTHQAKVGDGLVSHNEKTYVVGAPYSDWCSACRVAHWVTPVVERHDQTQVTEAEERKQRQQRLRRALAALHAYGFERLAQPRAETASSRKIRAFGRESIQTTHRVLEPAVPLGDLRWVAKGYDPRREASVREDAWCATGMTRSEEYVLMDPAAGPHPEVGVYFDDHESVGEALWRVLELHGIRDESAPGA